MKGANHMTTQMYICLGLFVFLIGGYVFAKQLKTTNGVVALCAIILTAWSGLVDPKQVLGNFANANVLLITGMFIVSAGFNRTQAVKKLSNLVLKIAGGNFTVMMAGYLLVTFLLSNLIPSPVAVFTILSPMLAASCEAAGVSPSKAMFAMGLVVVGTCGVLPVGSGAVMFATQNGYLESYGYTDYQMQLLDPMKGRLPIAIVLILYAIFIMPRFCPDQPSVPITLESAKSRQKGGKEIPPLSPVREALGYGIFTVVTLCLILNSKFNIGEAWQIAYTGAALLLLTGVLTPKEAINAIPMRIVMMLAAAQSVGGALTECGLGNLIGDTIANSLGGTTNGFVIGAVFFVIPFIMTQLMNNASVGNIFRPILILTCASLKCDPIGPLILLQAASLTAFMTPMATGSVPIAMDLGGYDQKDLLKMGWLPSIIICVISVIWVMTIFPAYH